MAAELSGLSIQQTIAQGPVWDELRARQEPLGRSVRLWRLAHGVLPTSPLAQDLRRKAQALAELDHPTITRLLDFRETDETILLVVEDTINESLKALLSQPLPLDACIQLGLSLTAALRHAHSRGMVHGRLAPDVVRFDHEGRVKLEGFGSLLPAGEVEPLEPEGHTGLAPETTIGQNPSPMSDLFCLGALLYQALTGKAPFGDPTEPGYAVRVRNAPPAPLIKERPDSPLALRQLIEQCLEKRAAKRPSDASQIAAVLDAARKPNTESALRQELSRRGLIAASEVAQAQGTSVRATKRYRPGRLETIALGCVMGGFVTYGALRFQKEQEQTPSPILTLSTSRATEEMQLRVVATPWAHILVDGAHRETTPFAQPLRLTPGRHLVRLEHPNAPPEERVVEGQAGQAILLDVRMSVNRPVGDGTETPHLPEDDTP